MADPDVGQRGDRDKIDLRLPFFEKTLIYDKFLDCFLRNTRPLGEIGGFHAARLA
jgi:hypothetical protein